MVRKEVGKEVCGDLSLRLALIPLGKDEHRLVINR
jgi:hypothetical protein